MVILIVLLFGLAIGSFLNVLIARYKVLETVIATRSHCQSCKRDIAWYDLIPLLSFVLLRGKCRYCREQISWQYPFVEGLTALLAVGLYLTYGLSLVSFMLFVVFCLLLVVAVIDLHDYVIPDEFMLPAILIAYSVSFFRFDYQPNLLVWSVLLSGGGLAALVFLSRERWMGMGDISLGIILGLLASLSGVVVGLALAFIVGALVSGFLLLSGRKRLKDTVPFGPFLAGATLVATLWGEELASWYLTTIGYV